VLLITPNRTRNASRYNRTSQEECLTLERPTDLEQAHSVTEAFVQHYNVERPLKATLLW
jgi:transposase